MYKRQPAFRYTLIPLMMAPIGAVETFGLVVNPGPRPYSPVLASNITDTGRESLRKTLHTQIVSYFRSRPS